jgi:3-methyladenine DNA glycosylase Mpg
MFGKILIFFQGHRSNWKESECNVVVGVRLGVGERSEVQLRFVTSGDEFRVSVKE